MASETAPASTGARRDVLWNAAAGLDPGRAASGIEAAIGVALGRNTRLRGHHITVTVDADGLVTLTGAVPTQALRREVELSCWTVPGVRALHDDLAIGRSGTARNAT
jgi:osmotically-inducible protein OsmY